MTKRHRSRRYRVDTKTKDGPVLIGFWNTKTEAKAVAKKTKGATITEVEIEPGFLI